MSVQDDLERELFKQKVVLMNDRHVNEFKLTEGWVAENKAYLVLKLGENKFHHFLDQSGAF